MNRNSSQGEPSQRLPLCALLAAALFSGAAPAQRPPADDAGVKQALDWADGALRRDFTISSGLAVDAELRAAAQAWADSALPRLHELTASWLAEGRRREPGASAETLYQALYLRIINETALWQIDSAGPEHDRRQQQAYAQPRACDAGERPTLIDSLVQVWQQVPKAERAAHLAAEATLLQRWGQARAAVPPRPVPSVDDTAWQAVDDFVANGTALPAPLPPLLAWRLLGAPAGAAARRVRETRCVLHQWALAVALQRGHGVLAETEWLAHRYARLPSVAQIMGYADDDPAEAAGEYPQAARRLHVEGDITVATTVDADGRPSRSAVVKRQVRLAELGGSAPPVAFETMLDEAALARAARLPRSKPAAEQLHDGRFVRRTTFVFKLE